MTDHALDILKDIYQRFNWTTADINTGLCTCRAQHPCRNACAHSCQACPPATVGSTSQEHTRQSQLARQATDASASAQPFQSSSSVSSSETVVATVASS